MIKTEGAKKSDKKENEKSKRFNNRQKNKTIYEFILTEILKIQWLL